MDYGLDGRHASLMWDDILERNIETTEFCPDTDAELNDGSQYNTSLKNYLMENGFYVKPDTDGDLWVITARAYKRNKSSFTGINPVNLNGKSGIWEPGLVVKVYPKSNTNTTTDSEGSNWDSAASNITIGIPR